MSTSKGKKLAIPRSFPVAIPDEGLYVLKEDVKNPKPDRDAPALWYRAEVIKAGTRLRLVYDVGMRDDDLLTPLLGTIGAGWNDVISCDVDPEIMAAVLPALERLPDPGKAEP